jgi:hypothetical protein
MACLNRRSNGLVLKVLFLYLRNKYVFDRVLFFNSGDSFEGEILTLPKFTVKTVVKYECIADNGLGDTLRKSITIHLRGKSFI